jgi:ribosomal protein S19E (S16A)
MPMNIGGMVKSKKAGRVVSPNGIRSLTDSSLSSVISAALEFVISDWIVD